MRQRNIVTIAAFFLITLFAASAGATQVGYGKRFGIGAMLGEPSGLTAKLFLTTSNALDFGIGFWGYGYRGGGCWRDNNGVAHCDYAENGYFSTHVDYLWQSNIVKSKVQLDWHVGVGGRLWFWNSAGGNYYHGHDVDLAVRAPIGLDLMFQNPDFLEVFFEVAPSIEFYGPDFFLDWNIGVRFYF